MRPKGFAIDPSLKDRKLNKERFETLKQRLFDSRLKRKQEFEIRTSELMTSELGIRYL